MASSGSYNFTVTRSNIIESALRKCGVLIEGESASSAQLTAGAEALNVLLKNRQSTGLPLWNIKTAYIYPVEDVNTVTFGSGKVSYELIHTQLSAAAAASATTITVDSITNMAASDNIGIECADGTIHWDTINGAPSGSTVTLTTGLDAAAAVDANVYAYTAAADSPLRIINAYRREYSAGDGQLGGTTTPLTVVSREEFARLSNITSEGVPYQIWYDPQVTAGVFTGVLHFANRWQNGSSIIEAIAHLPFEDMDTATDNLGMPQEWFSPIIFELASILGLENGVPGAKISWLEKKAMEQRMSAEEMGMEEGSVYFVPATTR